MQEKFHLLCDRREPRSRTSILSFAQIANLKIRRWGKVLRPNATCTADGFFLQPPANVSVSWFVVEDLEFRITIELIFMLYQLVNMK